MWRAPATRHRACAAEPARAALAAGPGKDHKTSGFPRLPKGRTPDGRVALARPLKAAPASVRSHAATVCLGTGCLQDAGLDRHASNVFAPGTHEGVQVEIRRFGHDPTEHHRHPALRTPATHRFIGYRIRGSHGAF